MNARITYTPGPWWALVRHSHLVLLPEGTEREHLDGLWKALEWNPGVESLLSAVLSFRGLALTGMAPFGIISLENDVHTILRGPVSLAAEGRELSTHVNGLGVTTWMERRIPNQESLDLALDDVLRQHDGGEHPWLPVVEGVVPFGRLHVDLPTDGSGNIEPLAAPERDSRPEGQKEAAAAAAADSVVPTPTPEPASEPAPVVVPVTAAEPAAVTDDHPAAEDAEQPEPADELPPEPAQEPAAGEQPGLHADDDPSGEPLAAEEVEAGTEAEAMAEPDPELEAGPADSAADDFVSADEADDSITVLSESARGMIPGAMKPAAEGQAEPEPAEPEPAKEPEPVEPEISVPVSDDTIAGPHGEDDQPDPEALIDAVPWLAAARAQSRTESMGTGDGTEPTGSATSSWGDHDGNTVMRGDLPTEAIPVTARDQATQQPATGPLVLGRLCPQGHANPPTSSSCGLCGGALTDDPSDVARPSLGRMVISDGDTVDLDRPAVVGRQPTVSRSASESMPRVVQVLSPSADISRSHLEVRLEGWHVMLVDLEATNGTMLVRQGMPPRRLGHGEKLMLLDGDIADLGDGVSLRFEGLL